MAAGRKRDRGSAEELKAVASVEGKGRAERRGRRFVGGYVMKDFPGHGVFLGKVVSFGAGLYKVWYEDGDCEELDYDELCRISVEKSEFDEAIMSRKKSLDQLVYSGKLVNATPGGRGRRKAMVPQPGLGDESSRSGFNSEPESMVVDRAEEVLSNDGRPGRKRKRRRVADKADTKVGTVLEDRQVELQSRCSTNFEIDSSVILEKTASMPTSPCGPLVYTDGGNRAFSDGRSEHCVDREADSYSDSCESEDPVHGNTSPVDSEIILPPPPSLSPSSTDIDVPLESIAELFSVYNFLRSFSRQLFLSPFSFNEFVASVSFGSANSILDAVHVSLLRALKRHLETLSSKGNVLESRILRHLDWSLLDALSWPVFLAEYLLVSGAISKMKMKITGANFLDGEYYASSASTKLRILQILCDDVVISAELMAELDMRAEKENDADPSCPTEGSVADVYPERANCPSVRLDTPGCTVNSVYSSQHPSKVSCYSNSLDGKADMPVVDTENTAHDGNSDECCLCGMDGMLVCCDGCPSAYHSRCVGINKAYLPEGSWFCPECVVDKMGSTSSRVGKGLAGAELFGVDPYGRAYFGTCNYLLVLEDSLNQETPSRYYNVDDIPAILTALCSSEQYSSMYSGICKGISQYWEISPPMGKALNLVNGFASLGTQAEREDVNRTAIAAEQNGLISTKVEIDSYRNHMSESLNTHKALVDYQYACNGSGGYGSSIDSLSRGDLSGVQQSVGGTCGEPVKEESVASEGRVHGAFDQFVDDNAFQTSNPTIIEYQNLKVDPVTAVSVHLPTDGFRQYQQQEDKIPIMMESATCASGSQVQLPCDASKVKYGTLGGTYQKVDFVPSAYTNQYIHGDIAASAAANLAIIAAEDNKNSSNNASSNPRKFASSNIALQMKAFLGAATYFFWPGLEKKSTEIPRDRCGWCISCQFFVNNSNYRKGCLLNAATLNSVKGASKVLGGGPRPVKNNVGPIVAVAAYVLHIEESLHGLTTGPWLVAAYRRQWRKQVEQASSCSNLKFLLLEVCFLVVC
ncbi:DDT domain-containing protein [Nymphaea thermarum]|nr:DDT domain-containing protein [Nymphaea thermarum]